MAGGDVLVSGRLVRPIEWSTLRLALLAGSALFFFAGLTTIPTVFYPRSEHAGFDVPRLMLVGFLALGCGAMLAALVELFPVVVQRWADVIIPAAVLVGGLFTTVALVIVGEHLAVFAVLYSSAPIFAFFLLRPAWAVVDLVVVGAQAAAVFAWLPHVVLPGFQWTTLMLGVASTAVFTGLLTAQTIDLASRERRLSSELAEANGELHERVADQVGQLERAAKLERFLAPELAAAVLRGSDDHLLRPHRQRIAVFFCDMRGFTRFAGRVEPEQVIEVLDEYYELVGAVLQAHKATIGTYTGDGIMAYLNDPLPCDDPAATAVAMALQVREQLQPVADRWQRCGYDLGVGMGIAVGHATLGLIGFDKRQDYAPVGTVVNLAARLCAAAAADEILVDQQAVSDAGGRFATTRVLGLEFKGFPADTAAFRVESHESEGRVARPGVAASEYLS